MSHCYYTLAAEQLQAAADPEAAEAQIEAVQAEAAAQVADTRGLLARESQRRQQADADAEEARAAGPRPPGRLTGHRARLPATPASYPPDAAAWPPTGSASARPAPNPTPPPPPGRCRSPRPGRRRPPAPRTPVIAGTPLRPVHPELSKLRIAHPHRPPPPAGGPQPQPPGTLPAGSSARADQARRRHGEHRRLL
jgi:hypothetical protein